MNITIAPNAINVRNAPVVLAKTIERLVAKGVLEPEDVDSIFFNSWIYDVTEKSASNNRTKGINHEKNA